MRLDINLATRPYEDAREFWHAGDSEWERWPRDLVLVSFAVHGWSRRKGSADHPASATTGCGTRRERAQAQMFLDWTSIAAPATNRSFEWIDPAQGILMDTRVEDLERVMPNSLHVVSLNRS